LGMGQSKWLIAPKKQNLEGGPSNE